MSATPYPKPSRSRALCRALAAAVALSAALLLLAPPAASAATYKVTLENGNSFESRFQPEEATWDSGILLLLTQYGNWIAISKDDVAEVTTDIESRGFGKVIDTKTVSLGVLANDAPDPDAPAPQLTPAQQLQQILQQQQQSVPDYTVNQFVEPSSAGQGGLPVGYSQQPQAPVVITNGQ